jgi:hypothetical protein
MGELTVWVDEKRVIRKGLFKFPKKAAVLQTVQQALAEYPGRHQD